MTDQEAAEKYALSIAQSLETETHLRMGFIAGAAFEREEILGMLRSFECLDGKRADAKSAFQLADWLESKLKKKEGRKG